MQKAMLLSFVWEQGEQIVKVSQEFCGTGEQRKITVGTMNRFQGTREQLHVDYDDEERW
mgnify:CR=1 FL=1